MMIETPPLDPGETLIWSSRPVPVAYMLRKSIARFLFGIFFFGFSVIWVVGAATIGTATKNPDTLPFGVPFWVFGIPFLAIGASMLLSPFWHLWGATRCIYALTNKRVLISIAGPFGQRFSMPLSEIRFVDVKPGSGGSGSIYFKETAVSNGDGGTRTSREGFVAVPEVDRVEQLLRRTMEQAAATAARRAAL